MKLLQRSDSILSVLALGAISTLLGLSAIELASISIGLSISYMQILGVSSLAILVTVVPISISGWGIRENMMTWLMTPLGVSAEDALSLSIWYGLVSLIAVIPGGILWLKTNWLRKQRTEAQTPPPVPGRLRIPLDLSGVCRYTDSPTDG